MNRPYENVLRCAAEVPQQGNGNISKKLGLALLMGEDGLDMLEQMAPLIGEDAKRIAALRKLAELKEQPMHTPRPLTQLQQLEKQLEIINNMKKDGSLNGMISMLRLGDEVSRKGAAALLPMLLKNADPSAAMLFNMAFSGGADIMNGLLNMMGKGGAPL